MFWNLTLPSCLCSQHSLHNYVMFVAIITSENLTHCATSFMSWNILCQDVMYEWVDVSKYKIQAIQAHFLLLARQLNKTQCQYSQHTPNRFHSHFVNRRARSEMIEQLIWSEMPTFFTDQFLHSPTMDLWFHPLIVKTLLWLFVLEYGLWTSNIDFWMRYEVGSHCEVGGKYWQRKHKVKIVWWTGLLCWVDLNKKLIERRLFSQELHFLLIQYKQQQAGESYCRCKEIIEETSGDSEEISMQATE